MLPDNDTWRNISANASMPAMTEDSEVYFMAAISVVLGLMILITIIGEPRSITPPLFFCCFVLLFLFIPYYGSGGVCTDFARHAAK